MGNYCMNDKNRQRLCKGLNLIIYQGIIRFLPSVEMTKQEFFKVLKAFKK
jgi:hypothetical protein